MASPDLPADPASFLARHAPFDRISQAALAALEEPLEIRFAAAGDTLLTRGGAPSDALWVIRKGAVHLRRDGETLEVLGPGECFGYPSLLGGRSPQRDAVAVADCLLFRFPAASFRKLLDEPGAARFFLEGLTERLRATGPGSRFESSLVTPLWEICRRPVATVSPAATVAEAARRMRELAVGSLLVTSDEFAPGEGLPWAGVRGIVTERDLAERVLAAGRSPETPVAEIASSPVAALPVGGNSLDALLFLSSHGLRHLPLLDGDRVVGLVSARDLVELQSQSPLSLLRRIQRQPLADLLPGYARELRRAVVALVGAGVEASRLGTLVASCNDALARRLLADAEARLAHPPVEVAWLVHGSDGRREQILPTDQDNALAWHAAPADRAVAQGYVGALATSMVDGLLAAGFPPCPGGYMATRWHDPLEQWKAKLSAWAEELRPERRLDLCTLLDLRVAAGSLDVSPLLELRRNLGENRLLLRALAEDCARWPLPLGLFGGLREGEEGLDLKRGSLLIVSVARIFALEAGSLATSTLNRLRDAEPLLGPDAATLAESFSFLADLRLEHAGEALGRAKQPGHRLHLGELNTLEKRFLKDIFTFLRQLVASLPQRFGLS
ncbi:MAG TPA: DUF294 nucleotidyltransferase-like domain-containing protein [Thermoanaerobaculia bacterium]|nr:DUF294 nucleotidyltransferase-like domain-containing protein [Thermoanaerobaculia bacterium]